jgi:glutamate---cysteine ligase / carboxylate-amine ligase
MGGYGSAPWALGVEEELLLVDAETHLLAPVSAELLAALELERGEAKHDLYGALVEIATPVCQSAAEAGDALRSLRARVNEVAARHGAALLGAGIHPTATFGDVALVDLDRYRKAAGAMQGLMRRTPECALHVHVGMPDADTAIHVYNALRERMPLLQALAANSPLWFGIDSGLASARMALTRAYPGSGIQRAFRDHADWQQTTDAILAAGDFADETFLWWDLRLHPRLGTVEVRSLDTQSSLATSVGIAALVHALARRAASEPPVTPTPSEALAQSSFRASRDGLDALLHDGRRLRPVRELAREALADAGLDGGELGGGADRQRAALKSSGVPGLLRWLVKDTAAGDA